MLRALQQHVCIPLLLLIVDFSLKQLLLVLSRFRTGAFVLLYFALYLPLKLHKLWSCKELPELLSVCRYLKGGAVHNLLCLLRCTYAPFSPVVHHLETRWL